MIGLVLFVAMGAAGGDEAAFDGFFAEFAEKRDGIRTLEARFTQESVVPEETLYSAGRLIYVKPKRIVFRYEAPEPTYLIDGLRAYEYEPDLKQVQVYLLEDNPQTEALFLGFDEDTKRLRDAYEVELFEPAEEPEGARGVVLRPKNARDEEAYFEKVTLFLRAEDYLPYRIHIVNDAESHVTIRVADFVVNGASAPAQGQIMLPEGTTIIEDDEIVETVGRGGKLVPEAIAMPEPPVSAPGEEKVAVP